MRTLILPMSSAVRLITHVLAVLSGVLKRGLTFEELPSAGDETLISGRGTPRDGDAFQFGDRLHQAENVVMPEGPRKGPNAGRSADGDVGNHQRPFAQLADVYQSAFAFWNRGLFLPFGITGITRRPQLCITAFYK